MSCRLRRKAQNGNLFSVNPRDLRETLIVPQTSQRSAERKSLLRKSARSAGNSFCPADFAEKCRKEISSAQICEICGNFFLSHRLRRKEEKGKFFSVNLRDLREFLFVPQTSQKNAERKSFQSKSARSAGNSYCPTDFAEKCRKEISSA